MLKHILAGVFLFSCSSIVNAGVITVDANVEINSTNYTETVSITKFDDLAGTRVLESVGVSITGIVEGNVSIENIDNRASTIISQISAELDFTGPLGRLLSSTVPTVARTFNASAFDGTEDFVGTSGIHYSDLGANSFDSIVLNDAATLAFFSGMGVADFDFRAVATSFASGPGNLVTSFSTRAGADIKIDYTYRLVSQPVAEPTLVALLGLGLLAIARIRRS